MKIIICTLLITIFLGLCCACATDQTDKYWKSNIETIIKHDENNLIDMWNICNSNLIIGISIAKEKKINDPSYLEFDFNSTKYIIAFQDEPNINAETNSQINKLCEIYEALMTNYKIIDVSCYYWNDPKYNCMTINLVDTTFYKYSLEFHPQGSVVPEDSYNKEFHTQIKDGFYMELYTPGL